MRIFNMYKQSYEFNRLEMSGTRKSWKRKISDIRGCCFSCSFLLCPCKAHFWKAYNICRLLKKGFRFVYTCLPKVLKIYLQSNSRTLYLKKLSVTIWVNRFYRRVHVFPHLHASYFSIYLI